MRPVRGSEVARRRVCATILALLAAHALTGCNDGSSYEQAIAVLIDVSGTYANENGEVARILKREVLPSMVPGDTLIVIRIDSESFDKDNVEALQTLDRRPSRANAQKLGLAQQLDAFASGRKPSKFTDIRGAMLLAAAYLRETGAQSRVMLVFSDMHEDLPAGAVRSFDANELEGVQVVALNVTQLRADTANPETYRSRLVSWEQELAAAKAAGWRTLMDSSKLGAHLTELR
jgi:hypothetical protein